MSSMNPMDGAYALSRYDLAVLFGIMRNLVEEARDEETVSENSRLAREPYSPDQALMDLLAILDNRAGQERRGGELTGALSDHMWGVCRRATGFVNETYWMEKNLSGDVSSKADIRSITYRALSAFIEKGPRLN